DNLVSSGNTGFTLANAALTRTGGGAITLSSIELASLTGTAGDDVFTVGGWTGTATLNAGSGGTQDRVASSNDANFPLTNTSLTRSTGGPFTLANMDQASLTGGAGNNVFTVSGWSHAASIDGGGGTDRIISSNDSNLTLAGTTASSTLTRGSVI